MTTRLKAGVAEKNFSSLPTAARPSNLTNIRNRWYRLCCLFLDAEFFIKVEGLNIAL